MQKWEYKYIIRSRGVQDMEKDKNYQWAADWGVWTEDGNSLPAPVDMFTKAQELGEQGWELVAVTPRADLIGGVSAIGGSISAPFGGGEIAGYSTDYAGLTTSELWVFKRPKS